jgi:hypothetical protein
VPLGLVCQYQVIPAGGFAPHVSVTVPHCGELEVGVAGVAGNWFTFTATLPVAEHELDKVTVTVKTVLVVGETEPPATLPNPLLHV